MTASGRFSAVQNFGLSDAYGSGAAAEEIRKLPFGEISWPMSGNDLITEVVGYTSSGAFGRSLCGNARRDCDGKMIAGRYVQALLNGELNR